VGLTTTVAANQGTTAFDPWGTKLGATGTGSWFGFQGDPTDPDTRQVDMMTRWYEPSLGRFTSRDVLTGDPMDPGSLNQFTYTGGNPVTFTDPTGMCDASDCPWLFDGEGVEIDNVGNAVRQDAHDYDTPWRSPSHVSPTAAPTRRSRDTRSLVQWVLDGAANLLGGAGLSAFWASISGHRLKAGSSSAGRYLALWRRSFLRMNPVLRRVLGRASGVFGGIAAVFDFGQKLEQGNTPVRAAIEVGSGLTGALGGGAGGCALGAAVSGPFAPAGCAVGGLIFLIAGGFAGDEVGDAAADRIWGPDGDG